MEARLTWHFSASGGDCPSCGFGKEEKISVGPDHAGPKARKEVSTLYIREKISQTLFASIRNQLWQISRAEFIAKIPEAIGSLESQVWKH